MIKFPLKSIVETSLSVREDASNVAHFIPNSGLNSSSFSIFPFVN